MQNANGTFVRKHEVWVPENWDDGYLDNKGRFRVYRPDYPRAYHEGYALRAHVVYWLTVGELHPDGTELHHKDRIKVNDLFNNLEVLTRSQHRIQHQENWTIVTCEHCEKQFQEHVWRTNQRHVRFCSQKCYHSHRK